MIAAGSSNSATVQVEPEVLCRTVLGVPKERNRIEPHPYRRTLATGWEQIINLDALLNQPLTLAIRALADSHYSCGGGVVVVVVVLEVELLCGAGVVLVVVESVVCVVF